MLSSFISTQKTGFELCYESVRPAETNSQVPTRREGGWYDFRSRRLLVCNVIDDCMVSCVEVGSFRVITAFRCRSSSNDRVAFRGGTRPADATLPRRVERDPLFVFPVGRPCSHDGRA